MGILAVRVTPHSSHPGIDATSDPVVIRVRSVPEKGRATEEARRVLARASGVPVSAVSVRTGARSREKVFEIEGIDTPSLLERLRRP